MYNAFDALVTNSEAIEQFLRNIGVTTRIEYIPNGVNLQRFHPVRSEQERQARQALRDRFGIPAHHKVIAVVGAIMPRKGPDIVLQAWRSILPQFPDTHVLFVGPRADTHDPKLKKFGDEIAELVATSGAAHQVHFAGIVDDVENYLRAADIFILASNREGTPNSVLEAMATGLPCLVTPYLGISAGIGRAGRALSTGGSQSRGHCGGAYRSVAERGFTRARSAARGSAMWWTMSTSNTAWIATPRSMKSLQPLQRGGASRSIHQALFLCHQLRAG